MINLLEEKEMFFIESIRSICDYQVPAAGRPANNFVHATGAGPKCRHGTKRGKEGRKEGETRTTAAKDQSY